MITTYHQINNIPVKVIQGSDGIYRVFPVKQSGMFPVYCGNGTSESEALWNAKNSIGNTQALLHYGEEV